MVEIWPYSAGAPYRTGNMKNLFNQTPTKTFCDSQSAQ